MKHKYKGIKIGLTRLGFISLVKSLFLCSSIFGYQTINWFELSIFKLSTFIRGKGKSE